MSFRVSWKREDGEEGAQLFDSEQAATDAAREVAGIALVHRDPGGSILVFRDGQLLDGAEEVEATMDFMHRRVVEILVTRAEEYDNNIDPDDSTGSGWRAGTPAAYGWQITQYTGSGPKARVQRLRGPEGTFPTPEAAEAAARDAMADDASLAALPIVHIH